MKKKILITCLPLIIILMIIFVVIDARKTYKLNHNGVFDYGKTLTIYEILYLIFINIKREDSKNERKNRKYN